MRTNVFGASRAELEGLLRDFDQPSFRAGQVYSWLYAKRVREFGGMSNLSRALREQLAQDHEIRWPELVARDESSDGSVKYLFRLDAGGPSPLAAATIESVYIPETARRTICVSTQAGCPLECAFCLTGIGGYKRNLRVGEILGQVARIVAEKADAGGLVARPWNVVVMGMGEPLLNCEATLAALRVLMDPAGFAIAPRRVTLSTVGILPGLDRLAQEPVRPNLAISLHAATPELRRRLMPIETRYPLEAVLAAARDYRVPRGGRVTFEYVLLGGVNDSASDARQLARLLGDLRCKVNLIPLNPAPEIPFRPPAPAAIEAFRRVLDDAGVAVSIRRPRGQDVRAACGQLSLSSSGDRAPQLA